MKLKIDVSAGELFDKMTILEIKLDKITDELKLANLSREYACLTEVVAHEVEDSNELARLRALLKAVNLELWHIEDAIRSAEKAGNFGPEFVDLARSVYRTNDRRASLKREINDLLGSDLIEEKSYVDY